MNYRKMIFTVFLTIVLWVLQTIIYRLQTFQKLLRFFISLKNTLMYCQNMEIILNMSDLSLQEMPITIYLGL